LTVTVLAFVPVLAAVTDVGVEPTGSVSARAAAGLALSVNNQ
jgi:hypothetical protein